MNKDLISGLISVIALACGFWFGGESVSMVSVTGLSVLLVLGIISSIVLRANFLRRAGMVLATISLFGIGWYLGRIETARAFNQCVEKGGLVRLSLSSYFQTRGSFPDLLSQLELSEIPGNRLLRPSLLSYAKVGTGYQLSFSDGFITHSSSESEDFLAHK